MNKRAHEFPIFRRRLNFPKSFDGPMQLELHRYNGEACCFDARLISCFEERIIKRVFLPQMFVCTLSGDILVKETFEEIATMIGRKNGKDV